MYCFQKANGCTWTGPRANLAEHSLRSCKQHCCMNARVNGAVACTWLGALKDREAHLKQACAFTVVPCANSGCTFAGARNQQADHVKFDCAFVPCSNAGCKWTGAAATVPIHAQSDCQVAPIVCVNKDAGCAFVGERGKMATHLKKTCAVEEQRRKAKELFEQQMAEQVVSWLKFVFL